MANQEHLEILARGVEAWNAWRIEQRLVAVDLNRAKLSQAHLSGAYFSGADLSGADLNGADLSGAELSGAHLRRASLSGAKLSEADLSGAHLDRANLRGANLSGANLRGADLRGAKLRGADLRGAKLSGTRFSGAVFGYTSLGATDLSEALDLESANHLGPSTIGIDTIYLSKGKIPEAFLRGAGVPDNFIAYIGSLVGKAIEFYSCFISYSTKDEDFAKRMHADLQARGVRCWFAPHDVRGGEKLHVQIDEAIRVYDKLLLVLSPHSMESEWVHTEIAKARKRELREKKQMLFPIRLVEFETLRDWECFDADTGKDSAREIREYFVPDFSNWKDHDSYQKAFDRLLSDLKSDAIARR